MKRFDRYILIAGLALTPVPALAGEWWEGIWASDPAWCVNADRIGGVDPAPIAITADEIRGLENTCEITGTDDLSDNTAVHLTLACTGEGMTYEDERLILRGDDGIWIWFGFGEPMQFHYCGEAASPGDMGEAPDGDKK